MIRAKGQCEKFAALGEQKQLYTDTKVTEQAAKIESLLQELNSTKTKMEEKAKIISVIIG